MPAEKSAIAGLECEMDVVGHQAKGVHLIFKAGNAVLKQFVEEVPIRWSEEDVLLRVATQDGGVVFLP